MRSGRLGALLVVASSLAAACDHDTAIVLRLSGPASATQVHLLVRPSGARAYDGVLAVNKGALDGRGSAIVFLFPDEDMTVDIAASCVATAQRYFATTQATTRAHRRTTVELVLTPADVVAPPDLAESAFDLPDLAGVPSADLDAPDLSPPLVLDVVAGDYGGPGNFDGVGRDARFASLTASALRGGVLYTIEYFTGTLRTVDLATGKAGHLPLHDAMGSPLSLSYAHSMVVDGSGIAYVSNRFNSLIWRVDLATAEVRVLAGSFDSPGSDDGDGTYARFDHPEGLALDDLGNLWVADVGNHALRTIRISPTVTVSTPDVWIGAAGGELASWDTLSVLHHAGGRLYVGDAGGVRVIDTTKPDFVAAVLVTRLTLSRVGGLVRTSDALWASDENLNVVWRFALDDGGAGEPVLGGLTFDGRSVDGIAATAGFQRPEVLLADLDGSLLVVDQFALRRADPTSLSVTTVAGRGSGAGASDVPPRFYQPSLLSVDASGAVYLADSGNHRVRRFDPSQHSLVTIAGSDEGKLDGPASLAKFSSPAGVASDGSGALYVTDPGNHAVRRIAPDGMVTTVVGGAPSDIDEGTLRLPAAPTVGGSAQLRAPVGIVYDGVSALYVADERGHAVVRVDLGDGHYTTEVIAGQDKAGHLDGPGATALFSSPHGLAYDGVRHRLFVSDASLHVVRMIDLAASGRPVTTVSGAPGVRLAEVPSGALVPTLADTRHDTPWGLAISESGAFLFVTNLTGGVVQMLDLVHSTSQIVVGDRARLVVHPGPLPAAVQTPAGVAVTPLGLLISSLNENVLLLGSGGVLGGGPR